MSVLDFLSGQKQTSSESVHLSTSAHRNAVTIKAIWNTGLFAALWYGHLESEES